MDNRKQIPRTVLIFGAADHIGCPLAHFFTREAPEIKLRLVTSRESRTGTLREAFPSAEVVVANYLDVLSLLNVTKGMEGVFVITPAGMDEYRAMTNLVTALWHWNEVVHIVRQFGYFPEANEHRIPKLDDGSRGWPVMHPKAKSILDESGLPVTYLNTGATFMDDLSWMKEGLQQERKLIWHNRLVPWVDPRDVAEVSGRLLLSNNHRHVGAFHTLNNGTDLLRYSDVAKIMSDLWQEPIVHDGSKEAFYKAYSKKMGKDFLEILLHFFDYEEAFEVEWSLNSFGETILGRKPTTLREWLLEHRDKLIY